MVPEMTDKTESIEIWAHYEACIEAYIAERRSRVDGFCEKYYGWKGALRIRADSIKEDLTVGFLNALWAVPFVTLQTAFRWLDKLGIDAPKRWFDHVPPQIKTASRKKTEWVLVTELLELPFQSGLLRSSKDSLSDALKVNFGQHKNETDWKSFCPTGPETWKQELTGYSSESSSAADLATLAVTVFSAWLLFGNTSLGVIQMGSELADKLAHDEATSGFFLGDAIGSVFYNIFPQDPSIQQLCISVAIIIALISILSIVIHGLIDPVHTALGVHQRKLHRFLDAMEDRLKISARTAMIQRLKGVDPHQIQGLTLGGGLSSSAVLFR